MTLALPAATPAARRLLPGPDTPVLATRPLRPGTTTAELSLFGENRWNLTPAFFQEHTSRVCLDYHDAPASFHRPIKLLTWLMLNHQDSGGTGFLPGIPRPAPRTVVGYCRFLKRFAHWLENRGITCFGQVTAADLEAYAADIKEAALSHELREDLLAVVVRTWTLRDLLPDEGDRLPHAPPWNGERIADILGQRRACEENHTPRVHPATMTTLLKWSLRFVEDFADDIIAAFDEYKTLSRRARDAHLHGTSLPGKRRRPQGTVPMLVAGLLEDYRARGLPLPGRRNTNGAITVNTYFLGLQLGVQITRPAAAAIANSELPVADDTYLTTSVHGLLDGRPWLTTRITYEQAPVLARHLSSACLVIIGYLSGQRPGETLNLERDCIEHDPVTGLILLRGKHWKGVRHPDGAQRAEGEQRSDPWVVTAPVATAVAVLQRLHNARLLFPNTLLVNGRSESGHLRERVGKARGDSQSNKDVAELIDWINAYCATRRRPDAIPADPTNPKIALSRLRRTLAWFIARRPRGLVAAAIQYGHVRINMTLGYSGNYASGFPDDLAFEEWLARLEDLAEAHERLQDGEHVSGPAADTYRHRVATSAKFAGRVLRTTREAHTLLTNPDLQIFPGKGMTCVLDPARAACRLGADERSNRRTPDLDDCKPSCVNIARTDRDIESLRAHVNDLQDLVEDPLAPPMRHAREQHELTRLQRIITNHQEHRP
jgi:integrase